MVTVGIVGGTGYTGSRTPADSGAASAGPGCGDHLAQGSRHAGRGDVSQPAWQRRPAVFRSGDLRSRRVRCGVLRDPDWDSDGADAGSAPAGCEGDRPGGRFPAQERGGVAEVVRYDPCLPATARGGGLWASGAESSPHPARAGHRQSRLLCDRSATGLSAVDRGRRGRCPAPDRRREIRRERCGPQGGSAYTFLGGGR